MTNFQKAFEFFACGSAFIHEFDQWNKLPFPAFVQQPKFEFKGQDVQPLSFSYEKQTLRSGPLLGLGKTVDGDVYMLNRRLKDVMKQVGRENSKTLLDSQHAMNPYKFQRENIPTRFVELEPYGLFSRMDQIVQDFLASQERVSQFQFTAVSFGRQSLSASVKCLLERQLESKREELRQRGGKAPVKLLHVQPSEEIVSMHELKFGDQFQSFEARHPGYFASPAVAAQGDQTTVQQSPATATISGAECRLGFLSLIASFTADLGAKLLVMDYCDAEDTSDELTDLIGLSRLVHFLRAVQLAVTPGAVQSGGAYVFKTKELFGSVCGQALNFLGSFYEEISVVKPMYSKILSADRVVVLSKKRRVDIKKAGDAARSLDGFIGEFEARIAKGEAIVPVDLDEEFVFLSSIVAPGTRLNDAFAAYLYQHNTSVLQIQTQILLYQFVHFANTTSDEYFKQMLGQLIAEFKLDIRQADLSPSNFTPGSVYPSNEHRELIRQYYLLQVTNSKTAEAFGTIAFVLKDQKSDTPNRWSIFATEPQKKQPRQLTIRAEQREVEQRKLEQQQQLERQKRAEEKVQARVQDKAAVQAIKANSVDAKGLVQQNPASEIPQEQRPMMVKAEPESAPLPQQEAPALPPMAGGAIVMPLPPQSSAPEQPRAPREKKPKGLLAYFK